MAVPRAAAPAAPARPQKKKDPARRGSVLLGFVVIWIVGLLYRLVDLQVVRREEFVRRARRQQERTVELPSWRGVISDAQGRPLAVTREVDSVFAIPSEVDDPDETAAVLAKLLKQPLKELKKKLHDPERDFVWVARRVDEETARTVSSLRIPGVRLIKESTRRYPQGSLAASVLGYVGADNQGLAGLEHRYDGEVRGRPVRVTLLRDAAQRSYAESRRSGPAEGSSLVLTLDAAVQHVVERELDAGLRGFRARGGSAVIMDPKTGAILALASAPSFDPNRYGESDPEVRRCRPVADVYEPGSTFKVLTAAAGLDAGTIAPEDMIDCGGGTLTIGRTTIHEHGTNRWNMLTLGDVLAHSSNIGIAHVGLGLGRGAFFRSIRAYGFGQRTAVELDGETAGILADLKSWSALTLPTMSFGQEIGVTVLQMARAYAAVANGGLLPAPHLVAEERRPDGRVRRTPARPMPRVMSEETARILRELLVRVTTIGTGKLASVPGFTVAGKTGTAQKAVPGGGYSRDKFVASFIGFAPAEDPRIVAAVVLDEPKGKIYGGDVAAPVFAAIVREVLPLLQEPASPAADALTPTVLSADLSIGGSEAVLNGDMVPAARRSASAHPPALTGRVPDVLGRSAREAVRLLADHGLGARLSGHGFVVAQDPPAGEEPEPGAAVTLVLSFTPVEVLAQAAEDAGDDGETGPDAPAAPSEPPAEVRPRPDAFAVPIAPAPVLETRRAPVRP